MTLASASAESTNCLHAFRRQVAGVGAGGALSEEDAHADGLGAGFLQGLHFAETDDGGELAAVHGNGFGGGGSALHGAADHVGGDFLQVGGGGLCGAGMFLQLKQSCISPTLSESHNVV